MKPETKAAKLAALLGLTDVVTAHVEKKNNRNKIIEIPEAKIQEFRAMQGFIYFLQAPELFTPKVCKHCGESFMVSRQFVSLCSYTCIKMSLAELGIDWNRDDTPDSDKIDMTIKGIWEGQEPLWLKEPLLSRMRTALDTLTDENSSSVNTPHPAPSLLTTH